MGLELETVFQASQWCYHAETMVTRRWFLAVFLLALACQPHPAQDNTKGTKLVLVLSVDQMLPDYLDLSRFGYTGGFKRLYTEGLYYSNADISRGRLYWKDGNVFKDALEIDFNLSELSTVNKIIQTIKEK